ncbi:unnamed protein product, partial [Gadus morhua 'NCC']
AEGEQDRLVLRLEGEQWKEFPSELQWMSYLKEWHVRSTRISRLPDFLFVFSQLTNLQLPKNALSELPPEIGKLPMLKELNANYNRLTKIPPELGGCENLERLELTGNYLAQLPFVLSSLKKLVHLDLAENKFPTVPICVLRMSGLQALDMSNNLLTDLPEDTDRCRFLIQPPSHPHPPVDNGKMSENNLDIYIVKSPSQGAYEILQAQWQGVWQSCRTGSSVAVRHLRWGSSAAVRQLSSKYNPGLQRVKASVKASVKVPSPNASQPWPR